MSDLDVLRRVLAAARAGEPPDMEDLAVADAAIAMGSPAAKVLLRERGKRGRKKDPRYNAADVRRAADVIRLERGGEKPADALDKFGGPGGTRKVPAYRGLAEWLVDNDFPNSAITNGTVAGLVDAFEDEDGPDVEYLSYVLRDA